MPHSDRPRIVTLGGGHGQAAVLSALRHLDCEISAVVATADEGGCSGELRREFGMPAPGDIRRCLSALALDIELASLMEERIPANAGIPRCRGNLVIARRYLDCGSLQQAADWVATRLGCVGRVMPASEDSGTIVVCDRWAGLVEGELAVERTVASPLVGTVTGAYRPNECVLGAIHDADAIIMGPGSFYTSTLSALQTGEVGLAVSQSSARLLFILNVANNDRLCAGYSDNDYISTLASYLTICSGGDTPLFSVLRHAPIAGEERLADGTTVYSANVAAEDGLHHSIEHLAQALATIIGLTTRQTAEEPFANDPAATRNELMHALVHASLENTADPSNFSNSANQDHRHPS